MSDRLTALDASFLHLEDGSSHMHVAGVSIFEGEALARGDRRVTDLARPHDMSLPAVSKHLRVLEKAGLLRRRRYGRVHEMQLNADPLKNASQWVDEYRKFWEGSLDRLAAYLKKTNKAGAKKGKA